MAGKSFLPPKPDPPVPKPWDPPGPRCPVIPQPAAPAAQRHIPTSAAVPAPFFFPLPLPSPSRTPEEMIYPEQDPLVLSFQLPSPPLLERGCLLEARGREEEMWGGADLEPQKRQGL